MKRLKKTALFVFTLLFVSLFSSCGMYGFVTPSTQVSYNNPAWAPPYVDGVRYYYIPDIETYYDLSTQQFVYLNDGQWYFSQDLPSIYAGFDLYDCFTVALDDNTYEPWLNYQYYVSHYPRYYYRDYYDHSNIPYVRGYNENNRSAIYLPENERSRARKWDNENLSNDHQFRYSDSDRRQQQNNSFNNNSRPSGNRNVQPQQPVRGDNTVVPRSSDNGTTNRELPVVRDNITTRPTPAASYNPNRQQGNNNRENVTPPTSRQQNGVTSRSDQKTNYHGGTIGQPVKVQRQMRQRVPVIAPSANESRNGRDTKNENDKRSR